MGGNEKEALFGPTCMAEIAKVLRTKDQKRLKVFQAELARAGRRYRKAIAKMPLNLPSAPANLSLSQRIRWLERSVLNPTERLLHSLGKKSQHMFATWPDDVSFPAFPNRPSLLNSLRQLHTFAKTLHDNLDWFRKENAPLSEEFRFDILFELTTLLRTYFPEVPISRGVRDREKCVIGSYPEFMSLAYFEITRSKQQLEHQIKILVKDFGPKRVSRRRI